MKKSIFALALLLAACNVSRRLPPGEKLYVGADFKLETDPSVSKNDRKAVESGLEDLARPRPVKLLFGFPYKVWLYYVLKEQKKENRPGARRFGEAPVFASARALTANETVFRSFLENEGYFRASAKGKFVEKRGYQAQAEYTVQVPPRYEFDSVRFLGDSTPIGKALIRSADNSLLRVGRPYRFETIQTERERINQFMKRQGFYYFQPDYVAVLADSAMGQHRVKPILALKPDIPAAARLPYKMHNVYIYANYTLGGTGRDTSRQEARPVPTDTALHNFYIVDSARLYKTELYKDAVSLRPGRRYNSRAQDLTLSRFINLGVFRFVRNRFQPVRDTTLGQLDTARLDVHYYLTPYPKKALRLELAGTSKSNSLVGSQLTLGFRNRNTLRRAELLTVNLSTGLEWQVGGRSQGVTNYRYGVDATLSFPRLVSPIRINYDRRQVLPKTNITVGYELLRRRLLYDLNSVQATFGYVFRSNQQEEHSITPLSITYVRINNFDSLFYVGLSNPATSAQYSQLLVSDQFILSSLYTFTRNSPAQSRSPYSYRITTNFEPAGNLAGLFIKDRDGDGQREILGQSFAQYVRMDVDARQYLRLAPSLTWASRFFAGLGLPYGNSPNGILQLPFVKQYFAGGSNGLRAFRPRTVGPGTHRVDTELGTPYLQDGGGDVKLEFNTELRPVFNKFLQSAVFLDVGNVWTARDTTLYPDVGSGAKFSKNWWKELAVGTGLGLRVDVQYFVIRLDVAFPLRKPWLPDGQRWVFDQINFRDSAWRKENLILNIAVGYPF